MFLLKTPRALAEQLAARTPQAAASAPAGTAVPVRSQDGPVAPTPIILRQRELGGSLARFAQARTLEVAEGTGAADIERAANAVLAAHPALRMRLHAEHGVWTLRTEPAGEATVLLADTTDATAAANEAAGRLDPESGDVIAFTRLAATGTLVITVHHIAVDAVSWLILLDDMESALRARPSHRRPRPTPSTPRRSSCGPPPTSPTSGTGSTPSRRPRCCRRSAGCAMSPWSWSPTPATG